MKLDDAITGMHERLDTITAIKGEEYTKIVMTIASINNLNKAAPDEFCALMSHFVGNLVISLAKAKGMPPGSQVYNEFINDIESFTPPKGLRLD